MKNTERFSSRADNYVKYRPHYPVAMIAYLEKTTGLSRASIVADIGAGTGMAALPFLDNGNTVFAVEPNAAMQEAGTVAMQRYPNYKQITGTAERTSLPDASIDLIIAGTAFHWFDQQATKTEFRRIARKGAYTVLMWNVRRSELPFEKAYEQLLHQYGNNYKGMQHRNVGTLELASFFAPHEMLQHTIQNVQTFDFAGLKGRLLSSSYVPEAGEPAHAPMMKGLQELFEQYQANGTVQFHYETQLYTGRV
ncbi:class I SAM-dependent methyltransferase [Chitinophaga nivalis]|uniref:Class I SAM-dependent methyltransferase n=1 Tax=Chitinophaga nivalis TaxID=2991709 RepID=A0ABT3INS7_9BACT|nr:class I SAM-dependent methyltransferase [Chitinophaga nivalis]MCW3464684.1 class I SAM-dependent methyltransferase [Chitinophaga nivalis]MCW3485625.1 class I SAM-dependent methyltransferase [Chitinophaga nivalis]